MVIKLLTNSARKILPDLESVQYTPSSSSTPWQKIIHSIDAIPLTGYPKQVLNFVKKVYDYYQAILALEEGKKALEKSIETLEAAMSEYQRQINEASSAGLLSNYIVPLQKQLSMTQNKYKQMIELLYSMTKAIEKAQAKISFLESISKKDHF